MQKALTAGLFMNAVQLSETTADLQNPSSSGINVYKMLHSSGPGGDPPVTESASPFISQ